MQEYGLELKLDRNVYLVDIVREKIGRVLKLDSINDGKNWSEMDTLIFNTWHWWSRRGPAQPYVQLTLKYYAFFFGLITYNVQSLDLFCCIPADGIIFK